MANQRVYMVCGKCFKGDVYDKSTAVNLGKRMAIGYYVNGLEQTAVGLVTFYNNHEACLDSFRIEYEHDPNYDYGGTMPDIKDALNYDYGNDT